MTAVAKKLDPWGAKINIRGFGRVSFAAVIASLYNQAKPTQRKSYINISVPGLDSERPMSLEEAEKAAPSPGMYFGVLNGRELCVDLGTPHFNPYGYDKLYGKGKAEEIIKAYCALHGIQPETV